MKFVNLAITGGMGAGKSTILGELCQRYGYHRMSWADPVKALARQAYGHIEKNRQYEVRLPSGLIIWRTGRELLQRVGTDALRDNVDADFWVKAGLNLMAEENKTYPGTRWVNDDSRFPNEIAALHEQGFAIVRLNVPDDIRAARLGITEEELARLSEHPSETLVHKLPFDIEVDNSLPHTVVAQSIVERLTALLEGRSEEPAA